MYGTPPVGPKHPAGAKAASAAPKTIPLLDIKAAELTKNMLPGIMTDQYGNEWELSSYKIGKFDSVAVVGTVAVKSGDKVVGYWHSDKTSFLVSAEGKRVKGAKMALGSITDRTDRVLGDLSKDAYFLVRQTDADKFLGVVYVTPEEITAYNQ